MVCSRGAGQRGCGRTRASVHVPLVGGFRVCEDVHALVLQESACTTWHGSSADQPATTLQHAGMRLVHIEAEVLLCALPCNGRHIQ